MATFHRATPHLFVVGTSISPEKSEEWNRWYDQVHIPEVLSTSWGPDRADRFALRHGPGVADYLALYTFREKRRLDAFLHDQQLASMAQAYEHRWGADSDFVWGAYVPVTDAAIGRPETES